jgi:hypothetical protein
MKHMNIVSLAEANALWIQFKNNCMGGDAGDRVFRLIMSKFEASIRSTPDNSDTLINYGQVLKRKASHSGRGTYTYLVKAFEKYKMARSYDHIWKLGINVQTNFKDAWQNSNQLPQLASMCFQACSAPNSGYAFDGLYNWALVLLKQAQKTGDDAIYAKAGEIFRRALKTRQFNSNVGMTDWATHSSLTDRSRRASLSGCELLTDAAINSISQGCSLLTSLRLNSCKRLKSVSLEHLNKVGSPSPPSFAALCAIASLWA